MIIICPSCKKKFEIDDNLIPDKGRLVKCGSCNQTWFFEKNNENYVNEEKKTLSDDKKISRKKQFFKEKINQKTTQKPKLSKKSNEMVVYKNKNKSTFTLSKFLSYLIVFFISFVSLILVLDTFRMPLYALIPQLETFLYSLFETIKDIKLFIIDLTQ